MDDPRLASIREVVEPVLAEQGLELVELSCRPQAGLFVRILVDAVGGVTIQQCARANQRLRAALEVAHLLGEDGELEVSSPGLDRPLVSLRDFERAVGEDLRLEVVEADGRSREYRGMLLAVQPDAIVLKTRAGNVTLNRSQIKFAKKMLPW